MSPHLPDETLQLQVDGLLDAPEARLAEAHLAECPTCADLAAEYRALFGGLEALPVPTPPPRFTAQVMARVAARERDLVVERRLALVTFLGSALLATLFFLLAGNGAWARQLTHGLGDLVTLSHLGRMILGVLGPIARAWRIEVIGLCGALCIPTLLALYRSIPRPASATS